MGSKRRSSRFLNKKFRVITVTVMMTVERLIAHHSCKLLKKEVRQGKIHKQSANQTGVQFCSPAPQRAQV